MPQLTTAEAGGRKGGGKGEKRQTEGREEDGVSDREKDQEQRLSWKKLHWRHWPRWLPCLAQAAALWLVVQEESLLHPSVSLPEAGGKLLLAGLLWIFFGLCVFLIQHLYHRRQTHKQGTGGASQVSDEAVTEAKLDLQACQPDAGHLVAVVSSMLDGFVVSILQEPLSGDSSLSQIHSLLTRLEAVSQAVNKGNLPEVRPLQTGEEEGQVSEEESSLKDRVKHICTYLQDRVSALHSLLQVQDQYGGCVAEVQQGLQERWELLENLHTRVTLQPEKCQGPEDPHTVLSDTENLHTQLDLFRNRVNECQTHLSTSTHLLQELESRQKVLAETVGHKLESTWTKDFLQSNTQQFIKVHEGFMSLEQQTLNFVTHLRGLRVSEEERRCDLGHVPSTASSSASAVPVYSAIQPTESPAPDPDPEPPPKSGSKLSAMNCLCGVRRRR
ncbi:uncharacterized protein [Salminus brasiliensis]|uniref:uncharacterized protein n=1 Tax=Salminus brasiliensis TaxID=930266 RepID=UPI003B837A2D